MTEEIINLLDCPAMEYIAVGNQYFCKLNSCDCNKICTCGYKRLEQDSKQLTQWLDEARNNADFWCNKCTSLEQECDELKKACEKCKLFDIEKTNRDLLEQIDKLEQENKDLKKQIESDKGLITVGGKQQYKYLQKIDELEKENNTICYNLHLAEKERDELKEAFAKKIIIPDYVKMNEQIDELKQENKELKETVKDLNQSIQNCNIQRTKMYKALEEIREIAKDIIENDVYENSDAKAEKILDKITEVLNEGK